MATTAESNEVHTGTVAEGGAHQGGAFPPFDAANFAPQLIWLAIVFGALYLLMSRVALPRVADILETRRAKIAKDVDDANAMQKTAEEAGVSYQKSLSDARANAQALGQAQRDRLAAESDAARKTHEGALNAKLAAAEASIAASKAKAMESVDGIAHDAASTIVQQILGKAANGEAISQAIAALKNH